jgi:hypothetical protein
VTFPAKRLPVGWIVEQVRTIGSSPDVIEFGRLSRFPVLQAFGTEPVFGVGIEPRLPCASVRTAAAETSRFGLFAGS